MSIEYNQYINEHVTNVLNGLDWLTNNLVDIDEVAISKAITNAINHDQSKWDAEEYKAYDDYFYSRNKTLKVKEAFDYAWLHHIHNNPHHWQHWVLVNDDASEGTRALEMPLEYVYEMIADWWSFSWKKGNLMEIFDWYDDHRSRIIFHKNTKKVVETILDSIKSILKMQLRKEQPSKFEEEDETIEQVKLGDYHDILDHSDLKEKKFGVPEEHKFPLPDADHVKSAIRFFNYVNPKYEKELAEAILKRMDEYGLSFEDFGVGDENRFKKYIPEKYLAHHGIMGQEWGKRNGPPYPLNAAKVAQKIFERASQKSKTITRSVEDAADSAGGELHGLEHQLKTVDSIERKINKKVDEKDMSVSNAATSIKDALRYTVIAPTDDFVDMYEGFKDSMARQGYIETSCDNYFDKFNKGEVKHKAVQSNFADTDGYEFEVQFHTPESQDAKDKKLPLYEERRSSGVSESRKRELEKQMEDLALNVPDPEGIERILSHGIIEDNFLSHHGIQGQEWGKRNGPPYPIGSQLKNKTPAKVDEIKNYQGKLYWLSESNMEGRTLIPRVPKNYFTENDYEDNQTPRLCFAPSVDQCLSAISQNLTGKTYTVYEPESIPKKVFKPNKGAVPDSEITGELWVKEPVKLKSVGSITVKGDDGKDGMKFEYGDHEAELYGWEYEWNNTK